jgi:hypothetical protein
MMRSLPSCEGAAGAGNGAFMGDMPPFEVAHPSSAIHSPRLHAIRFIVNLPIR